MLFRSTTFANGLYSTTGDVTQYAGLIAYCVYRPWKADPGEERTVSSTSTLPNVYTPYLRRDIYLNLPGYVSKCDPLLAYEFFLATLVL